ncbi:Acyl-CoA dehydrogenase domain protein OS=Tsukamurella paurometabola (strain ATCC 8368 / DSM/ CCUG 35730 / CIP 100753 / JCM 10117 / KCTC 9821 / NBRC 16120/ NCIMB 702349 / NCTC 13040) OX=521096 GN=Tpau_3807 PE=3 SV=1 [Tsukamurella paurometabola]|uniref:Acyl-CoA dehydrogenase domain protein n=1 Tax=Tsukamurella paurometabola (strain ATCC 8368 / DSM 20162 / CCUG 35730 / CIP 100753 / JCM 10117 / KCTC 9821 / NBRC 16120 / NCIMB 702349 / NCTC 13040) TaxID=521096 RepID=D5UYT2_TSUPD|nr:acyl-CoA dehydrogenase family protein [Tsukamurella paurometabola]ADG80385.1 acyl-CoA dehydrogenase domain protein [Tsukamurella paurometabola DSM 20162]SUP39429.1 Acyl-CoA dehydrogenase, short-chain specific [Tsukamurella paurometabola]
MDFTVPEAEADLAALTRSIAEGCSAKNPLPGDSGFDREVWSTLARSGILDAALPTTVGGGGLGLTAHAAVLTELGRTVAPAPYLDTILVGAETIIAYGTPAQIERWAVPVLRGEDTVAVVFGDDHTGFTATVTTDGWRLNGAQTAVSSAAFADTLLIEATTPEGSALFLVPRDAKGISITRQHVVNGTDTALVEAAAVPLASDARLAGGDAPTRARRLATIGWCAWQAGVTERALELTADYARTREQFGKPIGSFQAVRQRLADAYIDVEAVRLTALEAAWRESEGLDAVAEIATAKFWAAEAGHRVAHTAVHVHGGVGIDTDHPTHRYFVAAKRAEFALGGATAHLRALGAVLAGRNPA